MPGPNLDPQGGPIPQLKETSWFPSGIKWADYTGRSNPLPDDSALSYDAGCQAVKHIIIYAEDLFQASQDLLGTNKRDNTLANVQQVNIINGNLIIRLSNLLRTPPMKHPVFQWMRCTRIASIKEYVTEMTTDPKVDKKQPFKGAWPGANTGGATPLDIITTVPRFLILTLLFQGPKYPLLTDAQLADPTITSGPWSPVDNPGVTFNPEWERYLVGWPQARTEMATQESRTAFFVETGTGQSAQDGGAQVGVGPAGGHFSSLPITSFPSPWSRLLKGADIKKTWKHVPALGLLDNNGKGSAVMLDLALATVDSGDPITKTGLFGYDPGTLRFEGYSLTPVESPVQPEVQGGPNPPTGMANLYFDVDLAWSFFDPPYDLSATSAPNRPPWTGGPSRGHNLGPFRGVVAGDTTGNNLWYRIGGSPVKDPAGPTAGDGEPLLFPYFDHRLMFCMLVG